MQIGLIGAGNMARALARGWGRPILCTDVLPERARALAEETGGQALPGAADVARSADLVVLCHKPAQLEEVAGQVGGRATAVASILAATPTSRIEAAYPGLPVYRFIPNIPAEVRRGVLCYAPGSLASEGHEDELVELFGRAGAVIPLDEELIEPAMAIMSCGPAFMSLVAESFADAGAAHGLAQEDARRLTVETMAGTAAWLGAHDFDLEDLRARVATPGGATERGLLKLESEGLRDVCRAAVDAVVEGTR
jgi:pyrroline-5-carboxylate reductase